MPRLRDENRPLQDDAKEKAFRTDLFYRLNALTVRLPPIRERQSDILPLAEYFLARYAKRNQIAATGLAADAARRTSDRDALTNPA
jgi:DNA-binding NtrC family response regulator